MNGRTLVGLLALGGLAWWLWSRSRSVAGMPAGVTPVRDASGNFVISGSGAPGLPAGSNGRFDLGNGTILDTRGVPLGAQLSNGHTWGGVTVADVSGPGYQYDPHGEM
jgi:hypothetical protein